MPHPPGMQRFLVVRSLVWVVMAGVGVEAYVCFPQMMMNSNRLYCLFPGPGEDGYKGQYVKQQAKEQKSRRQQQESKHLLPWASCQ